MYENVAQILPTSTKKFEALNNLNILGECFSPDL